MEPQRGITHEFEVLPVAPAAAPVAATGVKNKLLQKKNLMLLALIILSLGALVGWKFYQKMIKAKKSKGMKKGKKPSPKKASVVQSVAEDELSIGTIDEEKKESDDDADTDTEEADEAADDA